MASTRKTAKGSRVRAPKGATTVIRRSAYLEQVPAAVQAELAAAEDLRGFLARQDTLTLDDRKRIVQQALILIEQNYAHLPLKRAMHSVEPVQRLRLLLRSIEALEESDAPPEVEFHREMTEIFTSVRDLHTNYLLPDPYNRAVAFLPFMVEDCEENGEVRYLVSHVMPSFKHATFTPGVEIKYWNGAPIARAVAANAQRYAGSNREARHARGVQTLTTRALVVAAPPDEEWVIVGYTDRAGDHELRFDWAVTHEGAGAAEDSPSREGFATLGLDLEQHTIQRTRKVLFKPEVVKAQKAATRTSVAFASLESSLPHIFQARNVKTAHGTFGYLRVRTFNHWPPEEFVLEFIRLLGMLSPQGLIIDVRGNGGGVIMNGEMVLQTLTARRIDPEPTQFLNTALNLLICERHKSDSQWADLTPWVESMKQALQTGATFSAGFPITDPVDCNRIGQKYFSPVALIVDALCYSTTDIFAAGFQDHEIGPIVGVDANTGAGGANVWTHQHLCDFVLPGDDSVYRPLPNGAAMRVSVRRTLRVGRRAGTPVEDLGVVPDRVHRLTRRDLLGDNIDLITTASALLAGQPSYQFKASLAVRTGGIDLVLHTTGLDRVDVYVSERPIESRDVADGETKIRLARPPEGTVEIRGFDDGEQVVRFLLTP